MTLYIHITDALIKVSLHWVSDIFAALLVLCFFYCLIFLLVWLCQSAYLDGYEEGSQHRDPVNIFDGPLYRRLFCPFLLLMKKMDKDA